MRRLFAALVTVTMAAGSVFAADKSAADLLKEIDAVKMPVYDRATMNTQESVDKFRAAMNEAAKKKGDLIGDFYKVDPDNEKLAQLFPMRWQALMQTGPAGAAQIAKDADALRSKSKNEKLKTDAAFFKAFSALRTSENPDAAIPIIEEFVKAAPKDMRVPGLLQAVADNLTDETKAKEFRQRILKDFPDSPAARSVKGAMKQAESVGKPFELSFTDAIKGSEVSMASLKGKVVVIDFWATWCGPCVAEIPNMKEQYAKYKDQGVEFIGVSLDQPKEMGGLDALKKYVKDNDVQWLQYYQGQGWKSEFSAGWGVNSIPCVFLVDQQGNLYSVKARGKLDKMIPKLLVKGKGVAGAGGQ